MREQQTEMIFANAIRSYIPLNLKRSGLPVRTIRPYSSYSRDYHGLLTFNAKYFCLISFAKTRRNISLQRTPSLVLFFPILVSLHFKC